MTRARSGSRTRSRPDALQHWEILGLINLVLGVCSQVNDLGNPECALLDVIPEAVQSSLLEVNALYKSTHLGKS